MRRFLTAGRRRLTAAACGVMLTIGVAGQASAYQVATSTGRSTATIGTAAPLTVTGPRSVTLRPNGAVQVTATIANPNAFHYWAHAVTVTVSGTSKCSVADFVANSPVTVGRAVAAKGTLDVDNISVQVSASASRNCQSATLTMSYDVS